MNIEWFVFCVWMVAIVFIHEGLAREVVMGNDAHTKKLQYLGFAVILSGAAIFFWNAQELKRLAGLLNAPIIEIGAKSRVDEFEKIPLLQRKELSIKLARAAYVNGGNLLDVVTEEGLWVPYSPNASDVKERDQQLKAIYKMESQQQELLSAAQMNQNQAILWLTSLFIAICTGFGARGLRNRVTKNL